MTINKTGVDVLTGFRALLRYIAHRQRTIQHLTPAFGRLPVLVCHVSEIEHRRVGLLVENVLGSRRSKALLPSTRFALARHPPALITFGEHFVENQQPARLFFSAHALEARPGDRSLDDLFAVFQPGPLGHLFAKRTARRPGIEGSGAAAAPGVEGSHS